MNPHRTISRIADLAESHGFTVAQSGGDSHSCIYLRLDGHGKRIDVEFRPNPATQFARFGVAIVREGAEGDPYLSMRDLITLIEATGGRA